MYYKINNISLLLVLKFAKYKQNFSFHNLLTLNLCNQTESLKNPLLIVRPHHSLHKL